jgi:hypothetical protein
MKELALAIIDSNGNSQTIGGVANMPTGGLSDLRSVVKFGTTMLMITAVVLAVIFLIWGGIEWITSGGNKDKLQAARKKITYAIIGLIITLGAFFIVNMIGFLFNIKFF